MRKIIIYSLTCCSLIIIISCSYIVDIPDHAQVIIEPSTMTFNNTESLSAYQTCLFSDRLPTHIAKGDFTDQLQDQHMLTSSERYYFDRDNSDKPYLDQQGKINLLVWNIYKQQRKNWQLALDSWNESQQLILLQEAKAQENFLRWQTRHHWVSTQANAFYIFKHAMGVMSLAHKQPSKVCSFLASEPWLQLPKSALINYYPLSNQQLLAVVNIHGINFTVGTQDYQQQLAQLVQQLTHHVGPIIFAGDFNSWNIHRQRAIKMMLAPLGLTHVDFTPDLRKTFINDKPVDHIYYRGLIVDKAYTKTTDASDHNPLFVHFQLINQH